MFTFEKEPDSYTVEEAAHIVFDAAQQKEKTSSLIAKEILQKLDIQTPFKDQLDQITEEIRKYRVRYTGLEQTTHRILEIAHINIATS